MEKQKWKSGCRIVVKKMSSHGEKKFSVLQKDQAREGDTLGQSLRGVQGWFWRKHSAGVVVERWSERQVPGVRMSWLSFTKSGDGRGTKWERV